ncbi:MAG TPA: hypothetical protein VL424_14995 [Pararobbsia sp.]|nr:hypothetical protein [Pararobbsia sp.]
MKFGIYPRACVQIVSVLDAPRIDEHQPFVKCVRQPAQRDADQKRTPIKT